MLGRYRLLSLIAAVGAASFLSHMPRLNGQDTLPAVNDQDNRSSRFFSAESAPIRASEQAREMAPISAKPAMRFFSTVPHEPQALLDENRRLRLKLQAMELDRLRALHNAVPVDEANALRDAIWRSPIIEVSWENPEAAIGDELVWVRDAVEKTWQAESGLQFTGWQRANSNSRGIRIKIEDSGPHCKHLGNRLDGLRDGMVLNFTFQNWCPQCAGLQNASREHAIRAIAVHEFGHAIGFAHEQNRSDAPGWCQEKRQGSDGDWYVTIYDPESIMNYCSTEWNNAGKLSEHDITAVRTIYGPPPSSTLQPSVLRYEESLSK